MKQVQKQQSINKQQSIILLKNMVRISVSSICFMRDLFPHSCFDSVDYGNTKIHQLKSAELDDSGKMVVLNEDAFLLTQWLERGVFVSLQEEYLKSMTFTIFMKHPTEGFDLPLESYEFKITYGDDKSSASINGAQLTTKEQLKAQASKFVRSLVEFTNTLDDIPTDRWITLSISYTDRAPVDYQPEYFAAGNSEDFTFLGKPLKVKVGSLRTSHQEMSLRFVGLESLLLDDISKLKHPSTVEGVTRKEQHEVSAFRGSSTRATVKPRITTSTYDCDDPDQMRVDEIAQTAPPLPAAGLQAEDNFFRTALSFSQEASHDSLAEQISNIAIQPPPPNVAPSVAACNSASLSLARIRDFILREEKCTVRECATQLSIGVETVESAFSHMIRDGMIVRKGRLFSLNKDVHSTSHTSHSISPFCQHSRSNVSSPSLISRTTSEQLCSTQLQRPGIDAINPPPAPKKPGAKNPQHVNQDSDTEVTNNDDDEGRAKSNDVAKNPILENPLLTDPMQAKRNRAGYEAAPLSQDSDVGTDHSDRRRNVRRKPDSVIRDPIHLPPLVSTAQGVEVRRHSHSSGRRQR